MKVFNNFEDWPRPVEKKGQPRGTAVEDKNKENSPKKKNTKLEENKEAPQDGTRLKSKHAKKQEAKPEFSPEEIREKVEISKNMKAVTKNMKADRVSSSMPEVNAEKETVEPVGDVRKNDPNDPATIGKLKDLLSKGGVGFSEKERQVISKIIEE